MIYPLIYGQLIITRLLIWTKTHINLHIEVNTKPTNYALQIDLQKEGCQILQTTHPNQICSNSKGMVQKNLNSNILHRKIKMTKIVLHMK